MDGERLIFNQNLDGMSEDAMQAEIKKLQDRVATQTRKQTLIQNTKVV